MTQDQKSLIEKIRQQLNVTLPDGSKVLLYGSQARGDNHEDSDWDILILVNKPRVTLAENTAISYPLVMLGWNNGVEINPVLYTTDEWRSNAGTPFYENVERDGILIS